MAFDTILKSHYVRFLGGGVICSGINNVILIAGDYLGIGYVVLTFICYITSGSVGYLFHSRITFRNAMTLKGYFNFIFGISLGLPVSLAILAILHDLLALPMWFAAPAMTVLMVVYHYLIARFTITSRKASAARPAHFGLEYSDAAPLCPAAPAASPAGGAGKGAR